MELFSALFGSVKAPESKVIISRERQKIGKSSINLFF